jgi:hypothetical protein
LMGRKKKPEGHRFKTAIFFEGWEFHFTNHPKCLQHPEFGIWYYNISI